MSCLLQASSYTNISFTLCRGWFGGERTEQVGGYNSKLYDMQVSTQFILTLEGI